IIDDAGNCSSKADGGSGVQPNVECLLFNEEQSSYLVGVAAALATKTKNVGFIGGVNEPLIQKFQAGFQAGVKAVDPAIKGQFKAGSTRFGLKVNGVGYATSNSKIDPYKAKIESYKAKIISGAITVPTTI